MIPGWLKESTAGVDRQPTVDLVKKFEKEEIEVQNETNLVMRLATYNVMTLRDKDVGTGQRGEDRKAALLREQFASG